MPAPKDRPAPSLLSRLGPGILLAGAAIGVSHLVQATRAGAEYGTQLVGLVLLIHLVKYPFFEYGHRYAAATGESLLHGYARLGRVFLVAFVLMVAVSGLVTVAGVTFVTAALAQSVFGGVLDPTVWSAALILVCAAILVAGHYRWLDVSMKVVMAVLLVATLVALALALGHGPVAQPGFRSPPAFGAAAIGFLIALMGWMPAPIEGAAFQSLWVLARNRTRGERMSGADARLDFNVGYALTVVTATAFLLLGAWVLHGAGVAFAASGQGFAAQFVSLYKQTLGGWTGPIIAVAAMTTMFSTLLAIADAYPRSLAVGVQLLRGRETSRDGALYWAALALIGAIAVIIVHAFLGSLRGLIDLATTMAFLSAPVLGFLNFRLITSRHTPEEHRPGRALRALSWFGIVYFVGFSALFLIWRPA